MKFITLEDFKKTAAEDKYYHLERWELYSRVVDILKGMDIQSSLELGPHLLPIVHDGHTMDKRDTLPPTIQHDATVVPWPIERRYDCFIALQVWEHLKGNQQAAFSEVQKFADNAVLSFPYKWDCPKNPSHHSITCDTIEKWTNGFSPESITVVPSKTDRRRIIYHFKLK